MPTEAERSHEVFERHRAWADDNYGAISRVIAIADDLRGAVRALQNCTVADPSGQRVEGLRRAYRRFESVVGRLPDLPSQAVGVHGDGFGVAIAAADSLFDSYA
jgi:hypothetical protein